MLKVCFLKIKKSHQRYLETLLSVMPLSDRKRILKLDRDEDRLRSVIGRLLLKKLLTEEKFPANILKSVKSDKHGRPFINKKIDFNIAHSGKYVICAISQNGRVGVDIEKIRPLIIDGFNVFLSDSELKEVLVKKKPLNRYFELWTQKEAVSKANGKGMGALIPKVSIKNGIATCEREKWILTSINIDKKYKAHIAVSHEAAIENSTVQRVKMKDLAKLAKQGSLPMIAN